MKFFLATLALAASAMANPLSARQAPPVPVCAGLTSTPLCCATDVVGVADLDCAPPPQPAISVAQFSATCSGIGQRARCCALPVLQQGLLCTAPV